MPRPKRDRESEEAAALAALEIFAARDRSNVLTSIKEAGVLDVAVDMLGESEDTVTEVQSA